MPSQLFIYGGPPLPRKKTTTLILPLIISNRRYSNLFYRSLIVSCAFVINCKVPNRKSNLCHSKQSGHNSIKLDWGKQKYSSDLSWTKKGQSTDFIVITRWVASAAAVGLQQCIFKLMQKLRF